MSYLTKDIAIWFFEETSVYISIHRSSTPNILALFAMHSC